MVYVRAFSVCHETALCLFLIEAAGMELYGELPDTS